MEKKNLSFQSQILQIIVSQKRFNLILKKASSDGYILE